MQNKYQVTASNVLRQAQDYLTQQDWTHLSTNKHGTILKKKDFPSVSPISCFMIHSTINKPAAELVSKIWDVNETIVKKGDHEITSWRAVESGPNWKVCHQTNSAPWPIWPRELAFAQVKIVDDRTTWLVAFSVGHPDVPRRDKEFVRAHIFMSIWGFTALDKNKTQVCRIAHVEPKGLIPAFIVDATVNKHVTIVEKLAT
jgi:hypothetical protein